MTSVSYGDRPSRGELVNFLILMPIGVLANHKAVKQGRIPASATMLHRCQGWVVCIIATIVLPELLRPTSPVKTEDDRREKCARYPDTLRFAVISISSAVTELPIRSRRLLPRPPPSR